MNKTVIFSFLRSRKADKVAGLIESIEELNKRSVVELEKLDRAETEEEVSAVEKTVDNLQKEIEEKEAEKTKLEKEIDELEKQIEEQNRKAPTPGKTEKRGGKTLEQREAFNHYLRTKEVRADGLKSAEGEAIIPVELMTLTTMSWDWLLSKLRTKNVSPRIKKSLKFSRQLQLKAQLVWTA